MKDRRLTVIAVAAVVVALLVVGIGSLAYTLVLSGDNVPALGLDAPSAAVATPASSAPSDPAGASAAVASAGPAASAAAESTTPAASGAAPAAAADLAGSWTVASGVAGYRVRETFLEQSADSDAVGRTSGVRGTLAVTGSPGSLTLASANLEVDLTGLSSDRARRDQALQGRGLEIGTFPTATFELGGPVALPASLGSTDVAVTLPGKLTLHGVTKDVEIAAQARVDADGTVVVAGTLPIAFADYKIVAPDVAGLISVQDHGSMEFRVVLARG